MKYTAKIENWVTNGVQVSGNVYGDSLGRFPEGSIITTSRIDLSRSVLESGGFITTASGSRYKLGDRSN